MSIVQKSMSIAVAVCFLSGNLSLAQGQTLFAATPVAFAKPFHPPLLQGLRVDVQNPFQLEFVIDPGYAVETGFKPVSTDETMKLVKYFLASLTVPGEELWVNLSPAEPERIIPQAFGQTVMGRDMLAQDYLLKQLTASLMNPEGETGKKFWERVYEKVYQERNSPQPPLYIKRGRAQHGGVTDSSDDWLQTIESLNKVWIIPDVADVYQNESAAYIVNARLKVMMEEDYFALQKEVSLRGARQGDEAISEIASRKTLAMTESLIREIILPIIEQEINDGEQFAALRQIYHAVILAKWFKDNLRQSLLGSGYADRNVVDGIDESNSSETQKIYDRYLEAFRRGAYDVIKEDYDPQTQSIVPRKYFTGGVVMVPGLRSVRNQPIEIPHNAMLAKVTLAPVIDAAMIVDFVARVVAAMKFGGSGVLQEDAPDADNTTEIEEDDRISFEVISEDKDYWDILEILTDVAIFLDQKKIFSDLYINDVYGYFDIPKVWEQAAAYFSDKHHYRTSKGSLRRHWKIFKTFFKEGYLTDEAINRLRDDDDILNGLTKPQPTHKIFRSMKDISPEARALLKEPARILVFDLGIPLNKERPAIELPSSVEDVYVNSRQGISWMDLDMKYWYYGDFSLQELLDPDELADLRELLEYELGLQFREEEGAFIISESDPENRNEIIEVLKDFLYPEFDFMGFANLEGQNEIWIKVRDVSRVIEALVRRVQNDHPDEEIAAQTILDEIVIVLAPQENNGAWTWQLMLYALEKGIRVIAISPDGTRLPEGPTVIPVYPPSGFPYGDVLSRMFRYMDKFSRTQTDRAMMVSMAELRSKAFQSFNKVEQKRILKLFEKSKEADNLNISDDELEFLLRILVSDNLYNSLWQTRAAQILLKVRLDTDMHELMIAIIRDWIYFKWSYLKSEGALKHFLEILRNVYHLTTKKDLKQQIGDIFLRLEKHSDILIQDLVRPYSLTVAGILSERVQSGLAGQKKFLPKPFTESVIPLDQLYHIYSEEKRMRERVEYFREMLLKEAVQIQLKKNPKADVEVIRKEVEKVYQSHIGLMVSGNRKPSYFVEKGIIKRMEAEGRLARKRMDEKERQKFMHATYDERLKTWVSLVTYREKFYRLLSEMTGEVISDPRGLAEKVMEGNSQWNVWIMNGWYPPAGSIHAFLDQLFANLEIHFIDTVQPAQKEELRRAAEDFLFSVPAVYPSETSWDDFYHLTKDVSLPSRRVLEEKKVMFVESLIAARLNDVQNVPADDVFKLQAMAEQYVFEEQMGVRASASSLKSYLLFMKIPLFQNFLKFSGLHLTSDTPMIEEGWFNRENIYQRYRFKRTFLSQMEKFQKLLVGHNIVSERYVGYRRNNKNNRNLSVSLEGLFLMEQIGLLERLDIYTDWQAGQEALGLTRGRWDYYKDRFLEFFAFLQERYSAQLTEEYSYDPQQAGLQARQQIETTFVKSAYDNQGRAAAFFSEQGRAFFNEHLDIFTGSRKERKEFENQRGALAAKIIGEILLPVFKFQTPQEQEQELFFTGAFEGLSFNHLEFVTDEMIAQVKESLRKSANKAMMSKNVEKILDQLLQILDDSEVDLTPGDLHREFIKIKGNESSSIRAAYYVDTYSELYFHPRIKLDNPFRRGDPLAEALVTEIKRILKASPVKMDLQKIYKEVQRDPRFSKTPKVWVRFAVETEKSIKKDPKLIRRSILEMRQTTKKRQALIREIIKRPENKNLTAVQIQGMLKDKSYRASLDVIRRDVRSVRVSMGRSVETRDLKEVEKRRKKILEILDAAEHPLTRLEILAKLYEMPEYRYVSRSTLKNDTLLDPKIKNHPNLKIEEAPAQDKDQTRYRRNAILRLLERSSRDVRSLEIVDYLRAYPEFSHTERDSFHRQVLADLARDPRLKNHRHLKKQPDDSIRKQDIAEVLSLSDDGAGKEFYEGLVRMLSDERELFMKEDFYILRRSLKVSVTKAYFPKFSLEYLKLFARYEQAVLSDRYRCYTHYSYNPVILIEFFEARSSIPVGYVWFQALYGEDEYIESIHNDNGKSRPLNKVLQNVKNVFRHMTGLNHIKEKLFHGRDMNNRRSLPILIRHGQDPEQATIIFVKQSIEHLYTNKAMLTKTAGALVNVARSRFPNESPGGVDFRMDGFDVKVDGEAQVFDSAMISRVKINGLHPVSIKLTPLKDLAAFLGSPAQIAAGPS